MEQINKEIKVRFSNCFGKNPIYMCLLTTEKRNY